jgi:hypothetical protein
MDSQTKIFKVAAGQKGRDFSKSFLAQDFAAIGPGHYGDWREYPDKADAREGDKRALNAMVSMKKDDLVVLSVGQDAISVGRVEEPYRFNEEWGTFGQWDLVHSVRVKWARPGEDEPMVQEALALADQQYSAGLEDQEELDQPSRPKVTPYGRLCHFRGSGKTPQLMRWAETVDQELEERGYWRRSLDPVELMLDDPEVDPSNLDGFRALPASVQSDLRDVFERAGRVDRGMADHGSYSEHGAVALIVIPFLEALGWRPDQIALERKRVDVSVFASDEDELPILLIEAKSPGMGLDWALGQARRYAADDEDHKLRCPILTTDGFYWALFEDPDSDEPCGELVMPGIREKASGFFAGLLRLGLVRL